MDRSSTADPAVRVDGLVLRGGDGALVDGVSLCAATGSITAVTGPSGSGKTLLMSALVGRLPPGVVHTAGAVTVAGLEPLNLPDDLLRRFRRTRTTFVGQDPGAALPATMKVAGLVTQMTAKADREAAFAMLASLGIGPAYHGRRASQLSGGEQRRIVLVRGLWRGTEVVLLDEPFAGLDEDRRNLVVGVLRAWARDRGVTILVSGHDVDLLRSFCDQVVEIGIAAPPPTRTVSPARVGAAAVALTARKLCASVRGREIVTDLDLELSAGVLTALTGPSGAGKTTVARVLTGLHEYRSGRTATGTLHLDGRALPLPTSRRRPADRRAVQLIPQDPLSTLNPAHTVGRSIGRPLRLRGIRRRQDRADLVATLLTEVGLPADYADRYPDRISGGQRQRVAIARALAAEPAVLICDEITSALDRSTGRAVLELLRSIMDRRPLAVLFISHDLDLVREYCAVEYRLEAGRVRHLL